MMPKIVDHDARRTAIARAAVEAIAARGLDGVKLAQIARAAGCTTGAVTHYFGSKDDVLLAALEDVQSRLLAKIGDSGATLAQALPLDSESLAEWKVWLAFWGRAAFVPRLARVHRDYYREIEDAIVAQLDDAPDPRLTAAALIAAVDGVGTRVCLEPDLWPAERQRALLDRLVAPLFERLTGEHHAPVAARRA